MIGCGSFAGYHARRLAEHPDAEIAACVDVKRDVAQAFIARYAPDLAARPLMTTDISEALTKAAPDAVLIATPHSFHFEQAMAALDAGCHVFVEKPMVIEPSHARRLAAKVKQTGKVLVIGYNTPCTPEFDYLRRVLRDPHGPIGLGELRMIGGVISQNWRTWTVGTWRHDPALSGGGFTWDTGAHMLASLCWSVESPATRVSAMLESDGAPVDVHGAINIRFESGVLAALAMSGDCPTERGGLTFIFTGGRIDIDGWYGRWLEVHNAYGKVNYPKVNTDLPGQTALDNFIDAALGRDSPRSDVHLGVRQCDLMHAIGESAPTGRVVTLKGP